MTRTATLNSPANPVRSRGSSALGRFGRALYAGILLSQQRRARGLLRETLFSMSDAQLAEMGLDRREIDVGAFPALYRD